MLSYPLVKKIHRKRFWSRYSNNNACPRKLLACVIKCYLLNIKIVSESHDRAEKILRKLVLLMYEFEWHQKGKSDRYH